MKINEHQRKSMEINGNQWKSMEINGIQWKTLEITGNLWKSMNIYENLWKSMEIILLIGGGVGNYDPRDADQDRPLEITTPDLLSKF